MRNRKLIAIMAVVMLTGITTAISCKKQSTDTVVANVSFSKDIIPILTANCAINSGCHAGTTNTGDNYDFDSSAAYNTIISKQLVHTADPSSSLIYVQVSSGIMPKAPYPALSSSQISLILNWIQQGAKNN